MKDLFWRSMLGIFLLVIVFAVSLNMGGFIQDAQTVSESEGIIKGMRTMFKKMGEGKEEKKETVVVLDAGHGGRCCRWKNGIMFL